MRHIVFAGLFGLMPLPLAAQVFEAVNRLLVVPLSANTFEVIEARGEGPRGMWCAAADFAQRYGTPRQQRLYVKTPRGPSVSGAGRTGVTFTTDASSLGVPEQQSVSVSVRIAGLGLPVNHALQFCKDYQIELEDILLRRWRD
jgi:hypothetical protein